MGALAKAVRHTFLLRYLLLSGAVWLGITPGAAADSAGQPCAPARHDPAKSSQYYSGPIVDTHFHMPPPVDGGPNPQLGRDLELTDIVCTLRAERTSRVFAFFPVYEGRPHAEFLRIVRRVKKRYPRLFVRFIMPPTDDDNPPTVPAQDLTAMLNWKPGLFQGYGEIGLYKIKGRRAGEYPPDAPILQKIYRGPVRKHRLIVYIHPGEGHKDNLERALRRYPDITFIVHAEEIEPAIGDLMSTYPNVYYTVDNLYGDRWLLHPGETKQSFLDALKNYGPLLEHDLARWKTLIEAHPNRFMWGTDRGDVVWTFDKQVGQTLADYGRSFIGRLDPTVQRKFAYENAVRLLKR